MSDELRDDEPLDEDDPIPGSPRARRAMAVGLLLLVLILGFLIWFVASNTETREPGRVLGWAEPHPLRSWAPG